jgi:hypothetical protein
MHCVCMAGERVCDGCHPGHPDVRQPVSLLMGHCRRQDWRQGKGGHIFLTMISTVGTQNLCIQYRYMQCFESGSEFIRIKSGQWIRIRIRNPDPDQEGKNDPHK